MKKNSNLELSLHDFNADNPTPRIPVVICLDTSATMEGEPINDLNEALKSFYDAIYANEDSRYSAEICIITFGDKVKVESSFKLVTGPKNVNLIANGKTLMDGAIHKALDLLEERKTIYKKSGIPYYRPWLVIMTDGKISIEQQEHIQFAVNRCNKLETDRKITMFPIGIGKEANYKLLNKFSTKQRAFKITHSKFEIFFEWLSQGISVISSSQTGESINIPTATISTWGEL